MRLDQTARRPVSHDDLFLSRESDSNWPTPLLGIGMIILALLVSLALPIVLRADDAPSTVAATRPELKEWLEKSKQSKPRLPLPPPTVEEIAGAKSKSRTGGGAPGLGGIINNGRMRQLYLPLETSKACAWHYPDQEVAEIVFQVSGAVFFNRLTEPARLRLEPETGAEERRAAP